MTRPTSSSSRNYVGWTTAFRFLLRRNWLRMLVWVIVLAGLIAIVIISQRQTFPTQADRTAYAAIANTPAVAALTGLPYAAGTLGGILNIKIWMTDAVALAFAVIFLVARNGRAEEESGRTELLRAGALGRHAYTLANWVMVAIFSVVTGLACTGAAIAEGLPGYGALVMGASLAGVGLVFLGIAAVAGQLAQTSRGADGIATIVLGVAYLLRAGGDLAAKHDVAGGLSWASPLGWGQAMRSFGENNWAPLLLLVGVGLVLCLVSLRLEATRDLGAGLLPDRPGPRTASALTQTPIGLTLRLQRWSILGWGIGILIGGLFFGAVATAMANLLGGNTAAVTAFLGPSKNVLSGLVGYFTMAEALLIAAFVLQSIATIRSEEANGSVELQWTGAISRVRWAASRIVVPAVASLVVLVISGYAEGASYGAAVHDPSQAGHYVGVALAYWPTMLLVIGVVVFLAAWLPRASLTISWVVYGVVVFVSMFAGLLTLPDWLANNTPFTAIEHMTTGTSFNALPLVVLAVLAIVLAILGLARLRSRDYVSG